MTHTSPRHQKIIRFYQRLTALTIACCLVLSLVSAHNVLANSNNLLITPGTIPPLNIGNTFTITIKSMTNYDATDGTARGSVTYPAHLLAVQGVSTSGSQYGNPTDGTGAPAISQGSGTVNFDGKRTPGDAGSKHIMTVTFRVHTSGVGGTIGFSSDSRVNNSTTAYNSVALNINSPPSTTPKPSTPSSPTPKPSTPPKSSTPTPTPSPSTTPSNQPEPEVPQTKPDEAGMIDRVSVAPLYNSGTVTWYLTIPNAKSTLSYGERSSTLDKSAAITPTSDGGFEAVLKGLTPGVRYYFSIDAIADGGKSGNHISTITTRGFPVVLTATENKSAITKGQIVIGNRTYNLAGSKLALSLAAGNYSGKITTATASQAIKFTVQAKDIPTDSSQPESQSFNFSLSSSVVEGGPGSGASILAFVGILVVGLILLAFGFIGFMAFRRRQFEKQSSYSSSSTVIIDDGYDWRNGPR